MFFIVPNKNKTKQSVSSSLALQLEINVHATLKVVRLSVMLMSADSYVFVS